MFKVGVVGVCGSSLAVNAEDVSVLMLLEGVDGPGLKDEDAVLELIVTFIDIRSCSVGRLNVNFFFVVVVDVWMADVVDEDDECAVKLPDSILIGNSSLLATSVSTSSPVGVCEDILCCVFLKRK